MSRTHQPFLAPLFLQSLATAALACSPAATTDGTKEPVNVDLTATPVASATSAPTATATAEPTSTAAVVAPEDPAAYARLFAPVESMAKAFPSGVELVGFIDSMNGSKTCSPSPCAPGWKALVASAEGRNAVLKRGGKLEVMPIEEFPNVIGKVDSAEKAALRVRLDDYHEPGSCSDFQREKFECAGRSASAGIAVRRSEKGFEVATYGSRDVCGGSQFGRTVALGVVEIDEAGELDLVDNAFTRSIDAKHMATVECRYPTRGRMFEGFVDSPPETCELEYYVRAHRHEAAAILAFERLARELEAHGAPSALIDGAREAAMDETRHAEIFRGRAAALAATLGVAVELVAPSGEHLGEIRSLAAILRENAEEGCANETYAALVATHQSVSASSASFRDVMTEIAADEREHAALAHAIHAWGMQTLGVEDAQELEAHRSASVLALQFGSARTDAAARLGEPSPELARLAFELVDRALALRAA